MNARCVSNSSIDRMGYRLHVTINYVTIVSPSFALKSLSVVSLYPREEESYALLILQCACCIQCGSPMLIGSVITLGVVFAIGFISSGRLPVKMDQRKRNSRKTTTMVGRRIPTLRSRRTSVLSSCGCFQQCIG